MSNKPTNEIIKGAYFYYACLNTPKLQYQKKPVKDDDLANKEYVVDVLVPNKEFKVLKKKYKNKVETLNKAKTFDAEDFKKVYKVDPPSAKVYANADGEYTVFKLKRFTKNYKGEPNKKTRIVGCRKDDKPQRDKKGDVVGIDINIGNGTMGTVRFLAFYYEEWSKYSFQIEAIQILDLVKYENTEFEFDDEEVEWSEDELDDFDDESEEEELEVDQDESEEDDDEWDD